MSESVTIARPYAKAIFAHALAEKQLGLWSSILNNLAQAVLVPESIRLLSDPVISNEQKTALLLTVCKDTSGKSATQQQVIEKLVQLLAENKRLHLIPDIYVLYEALRAEQEKTLTVDVYSYSELNEEQKEKLVQSLSARLKREIALNISIDKSLLGGAIIRAGDLVIDGSVQGKLNKLRSNLAA